MATTTIIKNPALAEAVAPAVTPLAPSSETTFIRKPKLGTGRARKKDIPEGLWTKCPKCSNMIYDKELDNNLKVCPKCQHHFPIGARERIHSLVETCSFEEMDADMTSVDVLKFTGVSSYTSKLAANMKDGVLKEAVVTGVGMIGPHRVALGVMDFNFLGGSMGAVVGEKLTRLIETATDRGLPLIIISTSGGARMYEGMFSLMQMAKTSGALAYHAKNRLPYISVLTHPTYAGVMASYASLGDLILAEPGAMIGFAGPRVIRDTTQAELPPGFQTAEFLLEHGLIDAIIPRPEMKSRLIYYLDFFAEGQRRLAALG
ncbi:acetyl-CoA carboxylase, carboxyltransferase subunit beta [Fontisphaera persica]|jgi:acetyl-CoA carboxylase carboxyl transferase subunit beta|uniref:acetyl-CoA carboxylase, carboxyltransferase subunit beta n=1 Tax=Fontisphaera persica TaxID=2974023 RepID=UPI0024BFE236|nr:acetyl-CoA carboxylase, carboxyltransferase subunit beta [Fontisphaera persica]WCJ59118.1 acetyl-CoA carboxylase, carboxyltransferase subunit beta [Fontisphaera persica]